jgi:hypothetical protein
MQRELTITIDEQVYEALHKITGQKNISQIIEDLLRPYVLTSGVESISHITSTYILVSVLESIIHTTSPKEQFYDELHKIVEKYNLNQIITNPPHKQHLDVDLEAGYRAMAADADYEAEALEWIEGTIGDAFDETRWGMVG